VDEFCTRESSSKLVSQKENMAGVFEVMAAIANPISEACPTKQDIHTHYYTNTHNLPLS